MRFSRLSRLFGTPKITPHAANQLYRQKMHDGLECEKKYDYEKAVAHFDIIIPALENNSHDHDSKLLLADVFAHKGSVLLRSGNLDNLKQGEACIKRALELNPDHEMANTKMDMILFDKGEFPASRLR